MCRSAGGRSVQEGGVCRSEECAGVRSAGGRSV